MQTLSPGLKLYIQALFFLFVAPVRERGERAEDTKSSERNRIVVESAGFKYFPTNPSAVWICKVSLQTWLRWLEKVRYTNERTTVGEREGERERGGVEGRKHSITSEKPGSLISRTIGIRNRASSTISSKLTRKERVVILLSRPVTCTLLAYPRKTEIAANSRTPETVAHLLCLCFFRTRGHRETLRPFSFPRTSLAPPALLTSRFFSVWNFSLEFLGSNYCAFFFLFFSLKTDWFHKCQFFRKNSELENFARV